MAKLTFYHDKRSGKGEYPLKIRIAHNGQKAYINLGIRLTIDQWDEKENLVVNHAKSKKYNELLNSRLLLAEAQLTKLTLATNINKYSASEIKDIIESNGEELPKTNAENFEGCFIRRIESKAAKNTRVSNEQTLKRLQEYDSSLSQKSFEDIDLAYLERFDQWLEAKNVTVNSRAVYLRNIRAVFNMALDEELTEFYPFRKFKIKKTPTKKRNLSLQELRMLKDYPIVNDFQKKYRDIFMLCFYMRGINAVDLFKLTKENIRAGRINYVRSKTGKFYSVKIEPEMQEIFDRYKGVDYLLDVADGAKTQKEYECKYEGFLQRMSKGLKKIGPYTRKGLGGKKTIKPILPDISQYWCRHTTATLMSDMGYSIDLIASSLGHDNGNKTTNIYIEYNEKKVDEANRALIDLVNNVESRT